MEILWGIVCGLGCIIPGWGLGLSLVLAMLGPEGSGVYAIASGIVFNSCIEAESPVFSGSLYTGNFNYKLEIDHAELFELILRYKVIAWVIALTLGVVIGRVGSGGSLTVTWFLVVFLLHRQGKNWNQCIGWIIGVKSLVYLISEVAQLDQSITIVGIVLFVLPSVFNGEDYSIEGMAIDGSPNWVTVWWSSLLSLGAPGVSPAAVTSSLEKVDGFTTAYLSTLVVEVVIEGFALGQSFNGGNVGKALMSTATIMPGAWVLGFSVGVFFVSTAVAIWLYPHLRYVKMNFVAGVVGALTLVLLCELWAIPLAIIGFLLAMQGRGLKGSTKGLTFVGLLI